MRGPILKGIIVYRVNGNEPFPRCLASTRRSVIFLHHPSCSFYNTPPCEAARPFTIRPHRLFPVLCPVTYHAGLSEGQGTVWDLSLNGWRMSGDLPLRMGGIDPVWISNVPEHVSEFDSSQLSTVIHFL